MVYQPRAFINNDAEYDAAKMFLGMLDGMRRDDVRDMRMMVATAIDNYDEARG